MATPNIVPRNDSEGGIGTATKYWASAYIDAITTTSHINLPDNAILKLGTGADLQIYHDSSNTHMANFTGNLRIRNFADDSDIIFESDDGSGGTTAYLTIDGGVVKTLAHKPIKFDDNISAEFGADTDMIVYHSGSNGAVENYIGNLTITNNTNDGDVIFKCDDGSNGITPYLTLDGGQGFTTAQKDIRLEDNVQLELGTSRDMYIYSDGSNGLITNNTGNLIITNDVDDGDIVFQSDNGSGGVETYFFLDGSSGGGAPFTQFPDASVISMGTGQDLRIQHDGSNSYIEQTGTGDLYIKQSVDDGDIIFQSDDGSGGLATYMSIDGGITKTVFSRDTKHSDSKKALFGDQDDLQILHDGNDNYIKGETGDLHIRNDANDKDIVFSSDNGSGNVTPYLTLDGSQGFTTAQKAIRFEDNVQLQVGSASDFFMLHDGTNTTVQNNTGNLTISNVQDDGDIIFKSDDGSGGVAEYFRLDGGEVETVFSKTTHHLDSIQARFGTGGDLRIYHDGSNSFITDSGTGELKIRGSNVAIEGANGNEVMAYFQGTGSQSVNLYSGNVLRFATTATGIQVYGATGNAAGAGFNTSGTVAIDVGEINGEIITTIKVDIGTGAILSSGTAGDVIGEDDTEGAFLTRITTAVNGIVYRGEMICVEVPTTGDADINLAANSSATLAEDGAGEGEHVLIDGGTATLAKHYPSFTIPSGGIQNDHLYLTHGGTTAGTYGAGQFIIKLYGAAVVS